MGYDYGKEFRRLKNIRTNNFQQLLSINEWNGNIITFLDAIFQIKPIAEPFRQLVVPVMLRSLRIEPKVFFGAIRDNRVKSKALPEFMSDSVSNDEHISNERFCRFKSEIPVYFEPNSKIWVTFGIEAEDMIAFPISRKIDSTNLVMDCHEFVANDDNNAIDVCEKTSINQYLEVSSKLNTL